jgi:YidC/Oxa1 family membrane protein insertase
MYHTFIFKPLYNGLVYLMDILPWIDIGIAVIIFTIIVKLILFPLSKKALLTQVRMKEVEPEINALKAKYKDDRQAQALKMMEFYRQKGIKPFSGILLLLIQLPILFALISVFYKIIPEVRPEFLYGFVSIPEIKTSFIGFIDLTNKSLILSSITALAQYLQMRYSIAMRQPPTAPKGSNDFASDLAVSMNKQMKIMLPIIAFASTYWLIPLQFPQAASIIALYWSVSALFTLGQELVIRRRYSVVNGVKK